uniref:Lin-66-like winged helix domain-containing protein n=1 Tax=Trichuris muris TaxID=70415 RepID=A0A5S6QTC0_TRIMR
MLNPTAPLMYTLPPSFPASVRQPVGNTLFSPWSVGLPSPLSVVSSSPSPPGSSAAEPQVSGIGLLLLLGNESGVLLRICGPFVFTTNDALEFVTFNAKTFCDQAIDDLTTVLRVGSVMKFQAISSRIVSEANPPYTDHTASFVSPITKDELQLMPSDTLDVMRRAVVVLDGGSCHSTDQLLLELSTINPEMEQESVDFILRLFCDSKATECHLNAIHCFVSNSHNYALYNYVGTNSQKRRQFIENRRHIFCLMPSDIVCLVSAAEYIACLRLADELQCHGGCMSLQELFDLYLCWPDLPLEVRELIGESKTSFIKFLDMHAPIFSIFPSRVFVSLRSRLTYFDYPSFLLKAFGDKDGSSILSCYLNELHSAPLVSPVQSLSKFSNCTLLSSSTPMRATKLGDNVGRTFLTSASSPICSLEAPSPYGDAQHIYQPVFGFGSSYVPTRGLSPVSNTRMSYPVDTRTLCLPSGDKRRENNECLFGQPGPSLVRTDTMFCNKPTSLSLRLVNNGTQTDAIPFCSRCAANPSRRPNVRDVGVQVAQLEECKDDSDELWDDINKELSKMVFS